MLGAMGNVMASIENITWFPHRCFRSDEKHVHFQYMRKIIILDLLRTFCLTSSIRDLSVCKGFLIFALLPVKFPGKFLDDWLVGRCLSHNVVDCVDLLFGTDGEYNLD